MLKNGKITTLCFAVLFALALHFSSPQVIAAGGDLLSSIVKNDVQTNADKLEFIGNNVVGTGNVFLRYKDIYMTADKIIVNMSSRDVEAIGNVKFHRYIKSNAELDATELKKLQEDPKVKITIDGYVTKPSGRQVILVSTVTRSVDWKGEKATGNLTTGVFDLGKYEGVAGIFYIKGESAERETDGAITVRDVQMSSCDYMEENHDHYSITASKVRLIPTEGFADLTNRGSRDIGRYDIWA